MLHLFPHLVDIDKIVDHPPATFPPYDMFPVNADLTPPRALYLQQKMQVK